MNLNNGKGLVRKGFMSYDFKKSELNSASQTLLGDKDTFWNFSYLCLIWVKKFFKYVTTKKDNDVLAR